MSQLRELLQNPAFLQALAVSMVIIFAFLGFVFWMLRKRAARNQPDQGISQVRMSAENPGFSLAAYDGVIRKMKEQEKELGELRRGDRERATESASMSEAVLSNLASGVLLFSTANMVRQANPAARTLLGYASPFGLHARDIFKGVVRAIITDPQPTAESEMIAQDPSAAGLIRAVDVCLRTGVTFRRIEAEYRAPNGDARVLGITISPVKGANDETVGAACLISDLTEITRLSQQVRLRENMAALGEMSAGIAHEFKNSLATISGYAQMLRNASQDEFAGKIAAETTSLSRIVNDFLNFARPQGFSRERVDLRETLRECADEVRATLRFKQEGPIVIEGDNVALRQAFSNLLRNSVEATPEGREPVIEISAEQSANGLRLTLADNGRGIPADEVEKIFIPFFTTKAQGTGLGLALVHRIIAEHGGAISVASSPQGTTLVVTFTLPPPAVS